MSTQVAIFGPAFSNFVRTVMLCCEEKGVSYSVGFDVDGKVISFKSDEHFALHPAGKLPVLFHNKQPIFETGPICRYIDAAFDGVALQPDDLYENALVDQWSQFLSTDVDKAIVRDYLLEFKTPTGEGGALNLERLAKAEPVIVKLLSALSKQLGDKPFLCGVNFTIADALLIPMLDYLAKTPNGTVLLPSESVLTSYIERMRQRSSVQKVLGNS